MSIRAIITEGFGAFGTIPDVVLQGFTAGEEVEEEIQEPIKTGTGGIDPVARRRSIVKPTGTLHLPQKSKQTRVDERVDDSREIQAEVAAKLAREFGDENAALRAKPQAAPVAQMSMLEVEREIGQLLRKKLRTEEDELMMLVLMAAAAA
jgi:hypothetical protein